MAREVLDEAGVEVRDVRILGSQPWPIGRGGSCELMIGCFARAAGEALAVDASEMDECRWVGREELALALATSSSADSPYASGGRGGGGGGAPPPGFFVPPPVAIAHHLIRAWVEQEGGAGQQSNM